MTLSGLLLLTLQACTPTDGPRFTVGPERIYVVNTHSQSLSVIDPVTRTEAGRVALDGRPHGQAPSSDGRRLYVTTSGGHGEVIALDTATHRILWRIDAGVSLHQPALTLDDRRLFAPDFQRGVVAVVDVETRRVTHTVPLAHNTVPLPGPHNAYAGPQGRFIYQTSVLGRAIVRLDAHDGSIDRVYPVEGNPRPAAVRQSESSMYLQLSQLHGVAEIDLESGREIRRVAWPAAHADGTGGTPCHGLGLPPDERELWATSSVDDDVRVLGVPQLETLARIPLGGDPQWLTFGADARTVYVTVAEPDTGTGHVVIVDRDARDVVGRVPVGRWPKRIRGVVVPSVDVDHTRSAS